MRIEEDGNVSGNKGFIFAKKKRTTFYVFNNKEREEREEREPHIKKIKLFSFS